MKIKVRSMEQKEQWHSWYAWHPAFVGNGWVWLGWVNRRLEFINYMGTYAWRYR